METQEKAHKEEVPHKKSQKVSKSNIENIPHQLSSQDGEIDLVDLIKKVWAERSIVFISVGIFFLLGVFFALASPEEYTAKIVLMPQSANSSSSSNLASGVLRQFGISGVGGSGSGGTLNVSLYPEITASSEFCLDLMENSFYFSELDTTITLFTYFSNVENKPLTDQIKNYTLGLPKMIIKLPVNLIKKWNSASPEQRNNLQKALEEESKVPLETYDSTTTVSPSILKEYEPVHISNQQLAIVNELRQRITTTIQPNGMLEVTSTMPDPLVAAKSTELAVRYLTSYIKDYQIEKIEEDLAFIEKQYVEKQARYNQSQQNLARLRDRNSNLVTESARIELQRAQTEFDLAFNLYQSIAQQLEQARIKVQEETPSFKVLEPLQIPNSKSEPNEELIIFLFLFVGLVIGFSIIVFKILYNQFKHKFH
ncbi:Wzz/FepE/Etk N-terminal domain-containing protein [Catalinimonas niigatensis]|uniref:Wzz/FepE/Etk N-terminal domain-containing protein n=1 Tax=Catalinimonas niigatensis TaxID=1397264 RepID=UPI0026666A94|nr:Wzz/FepE/Etk N-terminal domain-containing protein [Catalinimonas niigatensis]WPP53301.1 Wzz/FepE/Etk N-terminal domain-containing protein [Catalinimonas niigatensis]